MTRPPALDIVGLRVEYPLEDGGTLVAVEDASLRVRPGEIHALVGESGAGKTTIGNAVLGLIEAPGRITRGTISVGGKPMDIATGTTAGVVLGRDIGAIFQDPMTSLNPLFTVESQLGETIRHHLRLGPAETRARSLELLRAVGIPEPERRLKSYPHQLSGGQRQRIVIAAALSCDPSLIVADEPTTALDVSIQAQILKLIRELVDERGLGVLLVTHNMGVVAEVADQVTIMHRGRIVESGPTTSVLKNPTADYAKALIGAVPRIDRKLERFPVPGAGPAEASAAARDRLRGQVSGAGTESATGAGPLLTVENVTVDYGGGGILRRRKPFRAVDGVSFEIRRGEVFGLVGESGCGKSTLASVITGLIRPTSGQIRYHGTDALGARRRPIQMVFQDPYASLNPRLRVGTTLAEPILFYQLASTRAEAQTDVAMLLEAVGMDRTAAQRFPHAFSGGQRQRLSIARALGARPRLLVCDEPTSSLDVSVQAQLLNLLKDLRDAAGLTILLISHDLAVIRQMCDRVAVMRGGRIVEEAPAERLFAAPEHPYTRDLLALIPTLDRVRDRPATTAEG